MPTTPPKHSDNFPPAGRANTGLQAMEERLTSGDGARMLSIGELSLMGYAGAIPPSTPYGPSTLSGEPGLLWETGDGVSVTLTAGELLRLARADLTPAEYFALRERFGVFYNIRDAFYDEATGESLQPMGCDTPA